MIFCHCAGVTDATISRVIAAGATSVDEISRCCGAGQYCAPCREELEALLTRTVDSACCVRSTAPQGEEERL
jgi:assimilatory nitrate reductase electron transfer subunit